MAKSTFLLSAIVAAQLILAGTALAQVDCEGLAEGLTEHSCFHAEYGPWKMVAASPTTEAGDSPANVDAVHTQWLVQLPNGRSEVRYLPQRSGYWAIFTEPPGLVEVRGPDSETIEQAFDSRDTHCRFLQRAQAFDLQQAQRYSLIFDSTVAQAQEMVIVIEKLDDFETVVGRDRDNDGFGDPSESLVTVCNPPAGYVTNDADCNDNDDSIAPDQEDVCDEVDNDCDGLVDNPRKRCGEGVGQCALQGDLSCEAGELTCILRDAAAVVPTPSAEVCNGLDDDCNGTVDDLGQELCEALSNSPVCVTLLTETRCGCKEDAQCGGKDSGRFCDLTQNRCAEGCFAYSDRNGCPRGEVCETIAPAAPGRCVDACSESSECGDEEDELTVVPYEENSGCNCRFAHAREHGRSAGGRFSGLALLAAFWLRRRPRRNSASRRAANVGGVS